MKIRKTGRNFALLALIGFLLAAGSAFGQKKPEKPLPNLSMNKIDGQKWNLKDERGSVVLLNFWATWCAPCRTEIPILINLSDKYKAGGLKVIGVSVDSENVAQINKFIKEFKIDYQIVLAVPGSLLSQQKAIPMSLLIDKKGVLAKKYVGAVSENVLRADIEKLTGGQPLKVKTVKKSK